MDNTRPPASPAQSRHVPVAVNTTAMSAAATGAATTVQEQQQRQGGMPHLECVDRVMKLPVVEMALAQSADVYNKVKASSGVIAWTLDTAEATVSRALESAAPVARMLEQPISSVDSTLCKGLAVVQDRLPIVNEPPRQIYETTKNYVATALLPTRDRVASVTTVGVQKAKSLKELSWNKANELLSTQYGSAAISGLDHTANLAERYLDYYFPPAEEEKSVPVSPSDEDRVAHTIGTVGHIYTKLARRFYHALHDKLRNLNRDNVQEYLSLLLATIHLTNYLNSLLPRPAVASEASAAEKSTSR